MSSLPIRLLIVAILALPLVFGYANPISFATPQNSNSVNAQTEMQQGQTQEKAQRKTQGVSGIVTRVTGNQMPSIGENRQRSKPQPIKTSVWVFSGRIPAKGTRLSITEARQNFKLVTQVKTDKNGKFFVKLLPGEYTIFAQYGNDLYLNSFLGDGSFKTVQVTEGKITETRLVNSENASF
ncbi:hypothetical protein [Brunnivagina elsteri]|uniref:Carboxypeptidase regulatory-like domain-containing protein n=1 Tax=Brunnivagina elsteri CCALA 953 TaxID=987040 RepID=A0A2A2TEU3_9CYAN|nr:hypothetical protein [Calothrix elsteri]PAX51929.1 hypothetical protein CK510_22125 [Calothrix elsteri CCALA 953]